MELILLLILAFISGLLVKIVDNIEDEEQGQNPIKWPLAILYGLTIGYLISQAPFAMIFLGAVLAQILMRKVDTPSHKLGFLSILFSLLFFGAPTIILFPLAAFLISSSLDEMDKIIFWDKPKWVQDFRPFLELAAIPFFFLGQWEYLAGILFFDLGYLGITLFHTKKLKSQKKKRKTKPKTKVKRKTKKKTRKKKR